MAMLDWWDLDRAVPVADVRKDVDVGGTMLRAAPSQRPNVHEGDVIESKKGLGDEVGGIFWGHAISSASKSGRTEAMPDSGGLLSSFRSEAGAVVVKGPRSTVPGPSVADSAPPHARKSPVVLPPQHARRTNALLPSTEVVSPAVAAAHSAPSASAVPVQHGLDGAGKVASAQARLQQPHHRAAVKRGPPLAAQMQEQKQQKQQKPAPVLPQPYTVAAHVADERGGHDGSRGHKKPQSPSAMSGRIVEEAYKRAVSIANEAASLHTKSRLDHGGMAGATRVSGGAADFGKKKAALEHTSRSLAKLSAALMSPTFHPSKKTFEVIAKELALVSSGLARQEAHQALSA